MQNETCLAGIENAGTVKEQEMASSLRRSTIIEGSNQQEKKMKQGTRVNEKTLASYRENSGRAHRKVTAVKNRK